MEEIYCFAGNPLDRASERRRDAAWIAAPLGDPAARMLAFAESRPLTRENEGIELDWQRVAAWHEPIERGATLVFLGLAESRPYFAIDAGPAELGTGSNREPLDARRLAALPPR